MVVSFLMIQINLSYDLNIRFAVNGTGQLLYITTCYTHLQNADLKGRGTRKHLDREEVLM